MNLNSVQLPDFVVAELYKNSLVDLGINSPKIMPVAPQEETVDEGNKWKYLGENRKNILIVVDYSGSFYLPDEDLTFLTTMLSACQLSLADVAIVNRNNNAGINYREYLSQLAAKVVFLFGIEPAVFGLPVNFPHFQLQPFSQATFLYSPALDEIRQDNLLKSKLWVSLKRLFNI
jgi:hypothetical protein